MIVGIYYPRALRMAKNYHVVTQAWRRPHTLQYYGTSGRVQSVPVI